MKMDYSAPEAQAILLLQDIPIMVGSFNIPNLHEKELEEWEEL